MTEYRCSRKMCTCKPTIRYHYGEAFCDFHDPKMITWQNRRETIRDDKQ